MDQYLISIIVPIYNAESTLDQCINSILEQTYKKIELILVDDGSIDKSEDICQKYARRDNRVRYYKKTNGGVSSARNLGISVSNGEYVSFIDSDDWLEVDSVESIMKNIDNRFPEYIIPRSKMMIYTKDGDLQEEKFSNDGYELYIMEEDISIYFKKLFNTGVLYSVCGRLYKRNFLLKNDLLFNTEIKLLEDFVFNLSCLKKCHSIQHMDILSYNIRIIGLEDYKYKRNCSSYFSGVIKTYDELFTLIKEKYIPVESDYYDMIMNYWLITIDCVLHSKENILQKMNLLKRIAVEVDKEQLLLYCSIQNVDTHYKVLFRTKMISMFFIVNALKKIKVLLKK